MQTDDPSTRLAAAEARERIAAEAYQRQQVAQRESEALYMAALERLQAAEARADAVAEDLARALVKLDDERQARWKRALKRYPAILPTLKGVAHEHGYAVAVHGSQARDLDVIAVPWVEGASPATAPLITSASAPSTSGRWLMPSSARVLWLCSPTKPNRAELIYGLRTLFLTGRGEVMYLNALPFPALSSLLLSRRNDND